MTNAVLTEAQAIAVGRRLHHHLLATALLIGGGLLWSGLFGWRHWFAGLLIAILYSNAFEYIYHRALLHSRVRRFSDVHRMHHESFGRADEALHVSFACSPFGVVILLLVNSLPFAFLDWLGAGVGAGVVIGFVLYYIFYEEIHWRIHLGKLPRKFEWMRKYHFAHHKGTAGNYNVFLPICDSLFGSNG